MPSPLVYEILRAAANSGASDIIFHAGKPAVVRVAGTLVPVESRPVTSEDLDALWRDCNAPDDATDHDSALVTPDGDRFRVSLLRQLGTRAAVFRRIRKDIPQLDAIGVPGDLLKNWAARPAGIILVCGPTGSGKSTTVASVLAWLNDTATRHVVTIEDPVEYVFTPARCIFTQREVGIDTPTFARGLKQALRQDPDVIFLGEIRDGESALTALQASETGHLVLATLHASGVADCIARLELLFPADDREGVRRTLAAQLIGVLAQRLLPGTSGNRVLACEFFENAGLSRRYIQDGRFDELDDLIARGDPGTAASMGTALCGLVNAGLITESDALTHADRPQELMRALRGIRSGSPSGSRS